MKQTTQSILGPEGAIARHLANYEHRPQQLAMAEAVEHALRAQRHLVVEAGTGTGKSLAYLTPLVLWAIQHRKRALVATHTKALQQQLIDKDLPLLREATGLEFRSALCVGSQNYLCRRRLQLLEQRALLESAEQVRQVAEIRRWAEETSTGLVLELPFTPSPAVWTKVNRESDLCFGQKCSHIGECLYFAARREQQRAQVLVANHHLFFAHLAADWCVLPELDALVFDEAQGLEEVASDYLGISVSNTQVDFFLNSVYNADTNKGLLASLPDSPDRTAAVNAVSLVRRAAADFFLDVAERAGTRDQVARFRRPGMVEDSLYEPLKSLHEALQKMRSHTADEEQELEFEAHLGRVNELSRQLAIFLDQSLKNHVYWVEQSRRRRLRVTLKIAPIELAEPLREGLFEKVSPIILTSATLATANSFRFLRSRLGLDTADELAVGSPFDFRRQVLLYVPTDMPDPSSQYEAFNQAAAARAVEVCRLSGGRAFVLFTSYRALHQAKELFEEQLPHFTLLVQGEQPLAQLVATFKEDETSILLGTNTFWQGIDIPGEALQCVVVTKLPFAVPDHPLIEARTESIEQNGGNAFYEYQIPKTLIMFRQGFGRLIRTRTDFGVFALLDPRVRTKRYGQLFLESLPQCKVTDQMARVSAFLGEWRDGRG